MRIIFFVSLMCTFHKQYVCSPINRWADLVMKIRSLDPQPYQMVTFVEIKNPIVDLILAKVSRYFPTIVIDIDREVSKIWVSYSSALCVLLQPRVVESIDFLTKLLPSNDSRPRCLLILLDDELSLSLPDIRKFLQYTWREKFLDFSVVAKESVLSFDPFRRSIVNESLRRETTQLFPYKMKSLHGYQLRLPMLEMVPNLTIETGPDGKPRQGGVSFNYFRLLSKFLNVTFNFKRGFEKSIYLGRYDILMNELRTSQLNVLTAPLYAKTLLSSFPEHFTRGRFFTFSYHVILTPIIEMSLIHIPFDLIVYLPILLFTTVVFMAIAKAFNIPKRDWNVFMICRIWFSGSLPRLPRKPALRVFYLIITALSMKYSVEILTKLMRVRLLKYELPFNDYQQIFKSNLTIFTSKAIYNYFYSYLYHDDRILKMLQPRMKILSSSECIKILLKNESVMCITIAHYAIHKVHEQKRLFGRPLMKIASIKLVKDMGSFGYENASPFVKRFDAVIQMIQESGITGMWSTIGRAGKAARQYYVAPEQTVDDVDPSIGKSYFVLEMLLILGVGLFFAVVFFVVELMYRSLRCYNLR